LFGFESELEVVDFTAPHRVVTFAGSVAVPEVVVEALRGLPRVDREGTPRDGCRLGWVGAADGEEIHFVEGGHESVVLARFFPRPILDNDQGAGGLVDDAVMHLRDVQRQWRLRIRASDKLGY